MTSSSITPAHRLSDYLKDYFVTLQTQIFSCPDQEGRKGSEEGVPENLGVPLEGDRGFRGTNFLVF